MTPYDIAVVCHEANRAYCWTLGDYSQTSWADAPEWQRTSSIKGVEYLIANPGAGADASHISWLAEKRATGWTYGPLKDPEAKTHPCFVEYDQLPPEQQLKDNLYTGIVRALTSSL